MIPTPGPAEPVAGEGETDGTAPTGRARVDLHTHTRRSDGVLEPRALVAAVAACGVELLAITDHDSLAAYRELRGGPLPPGLELLAGVELNTHGPRSDLAEGELHILGYGVDPDDEAFEALLAGEREERRRRFWAVVDRLRAVGLSVDGAIEPEIEEGRALGRPSLARALVRAGHAVSVADAFERILAPGRLGYLPRRRLRPEVAIQAIRRAGGAAVLAHFSQAVEEAALVRALQGEGLVGLEVYYPTFPVETVAALAAFARHEGLLATGGTDFHGDDGPYPVRHALLRVPPEVAEAVRATLGR